MHKKHLALSALLAATLAASATSFAQDRHHDNRDNHDDNRYSQHDRGDDHRGDDRRGDDHRGGDRHDDGRWQGRDNQRFDERPAHAWRRGQRLPAQYRSNQYVVSDWRGHHLRQPPRGYHWVQSGSDYVLAAIATGVIADILLNH
jgi:Ni/Co efflux regulator RcnB